MQHDEVIWQVIRHNHCSFMSKITTGIFCRNPYNVTGMCNRSSCPLANSRYATVREHDGLFYLYMKTIERAHMPNKAWERVKLPLNYEKALEVIDKNLEYWPKLLIHKIKQRLTKLTQCRIRMRKLQLKVREKIMTLPRKQQKREARRVDKAEKAAVLEKNIEKELLTRIQNGMYGDLYNFPVNEYKKVVEMEDQELDVADEEPEVEYIADYEDLEGTMNDIEDFGVSNTVNSDLFDDGGTMEGDNGVVSQSKKKRKPSSVKSRGRLKKSRAIEVENEDGNESQVVM